MEISANTAILVVGDIFQHPSEMNEIEFIPLIELATKKDAEGAKVHPGNSLNHSLEWNIYQKTELEKTYLNIPEPISTGVNQYRLFDLGIEDLETAIKLHIGDMDISESCSLFGGYAISINGTIELYPQCCGLLEEIQDWKNILDDKFPDFYLKECHPSPLITKKGKQIIVFCQDDFETFVPSTTKEIIKLNYQETKLAFINLLKKLTDFSTKLNFLSSKYETDNISNILIWGGNEIK